MSRDALRVTGKGGKERLVPVLPVTRRCHRPLHRALSLYARPTTPLFLGVKGGRLSPRIIQLVVERQREALGCPKRQHPMR